MSELLLKEYATYDLI